MDDPRLWAAVAYVERKAVRAGMVPRAEEYPWSGPAAHCGRRRDPVQAMDCPPVGVMPDWSA
jgi:hypothetical protein